MQNLLKIRFLQISRELIKAGWWTILITLFIYMALLIKIIRPSVDLFASSELLLPLIAILFSINSFRKDKRLLKLIIPENYRLYLLIEYLIFGLPFSIPYLFSEFKIGIIIFCISCFLIAQLDFSIKINLQNQPIILKRFISPNNFEWISGLRKNQYLIIFLYAVGIVISYWYFAGFIILGLITFSFSAFYIDCES